MNKIVSMTNGKPTDRHCSFRGRVTLGGTGGVTMRLKNRIMIGVGRIGGCMSSIMGRESSWVLVMGMGSRGMAATVAIGEDSKAIAAMGTDSRGMATMGMDSRRMAATEVMDEDSKAIATMGMDGRHTMMMIHHLMTRVIATTAIAATTAIVVTTVIIITIAAIVPELITHIGTPNPENHGRRIDGNETRRGDRDWHEYSRQ